MLYFIMLLSLTVLVWCLPKGKGRKGFLCLAAALICLPLGVIFALTKKYK